MPLIILKATFVVIPCCPDVCPEPILLIIPVFTFIVIGNLSIRVLLPLAFPVLETLNEITDVYSTVAPLILAGAMWAPLLVLTTVRVPAGERFGSSPVLHELEPLTFVFVAIRPEVNSLAMSF